MKLIVGLGNHGKEYEKTRHNLGFMVVNRLASSAERLASSWKKEEKFKAEILRVNYKLILAKPLTYMNNSGVAVSLLATFYKIQTTNVWVIHDDVDLPLGLIKIKFGGRSAGHKGVQSIIDVLGTEKFWRFRIGIKPNSELDAEEFVLKNFTPEEQEEVVKVIKKGVEAIETSFKEGIDRAMNRFNTKK